MVEEDNDEQLEIDSILNETFGERVETHWIDAFSEDKNKEKQNNEKEKLQLVQYLPAATPVPTSFMIAKIINEKTSMRLLRVLFDSGGSATMIHDRCLPKGCVPTVLTNTVTSNTIAGNFTSNTCVYMREIILPEFNRNKKIDGQGAFVFQEDCRYDVIFGRDFLSKTGLDIRFANNTMQWMNVMVEMKDIPPMRLGRVNQNQNDDNDDEKEMFATMILDAKYDGASPEKVAALQTHLTQTQRNDIKNLVAKYPTLFSNTLRKYPHRKIHLELEQTAIPRHARPYSVAHVHREVFKKEIERLVEIGVLRPCGATEWASPTMIIPKKDNTIRDVSDFRELNKVIKRRIYPLPRIQDVLNRRTGYSFFSKLDISMQFYTFELDEKSKDLCTIVTPVGKFQYNRLPMGIKCSPDIAQETMEEVLQNIDCEVYIDDIGVFSNSWSTHIILLDKILSRLDSNGFMINPLKCKWGVKETDWLGYWLTPVGLKPWQKKIDAILLMQPPNTLTQQ